MKNLKISKELLSEVLGYEVDFILGISENEIDYTCCRDTDIGYEDLSINIYEFAFKCKEWAWLKFSLNIFIEKHTFSLYEASVKVCSFSSGFGPYNSFVDCYRREATEIEAIVKVCEWLMKMK